MTPDPSEWTPEDYGAPDPGPSAPGWLKSAVAVAAVAALVALIEAFWSV